MCLGGEGGGAVFLKALCSVEDSWWQTVAVFTLVVRHIKVLSYHHSGSPHACRQTYQSTVLPSQWESSRLSSDISKYCLTLTVGVLTLVVRHIKVLSYHHSGSPHACPQTYQSTDSLTISKPSQWESSRLSSDISKYCLTITVGVSHLSSDMSKYCLTLTVGVLTLVVRHIKVLSYHHGGSVTLVVRHIKVLSYHHSGNPHACRQTYQSTVLPSQWESSRLSSDISKYCLTLTVGVLTLVVRHIKVLSYPHSGSPHACPQTYQSTDSLTISKPSQWESSRLSTDSITVGVLTLVVRHIKVLSYPHSGSVTLVVRHVKVLSYPHSGSPHACHQTYQSTVLLSHALRVHTTLISPFKRAYFCAFTLQKGLFLWIHPSKGLISVDSPVKRAYFCAFTLQKGLFLCVHPSKGSISVDSPVKRAYLCGFTLQKGLFVWIHPSKGPICVDSPFKRAYFCGFTLQKGLFLWVHPSKGPISVGVH